MEKKKYQLPKEFGEKWVAALRGGEYKQGSGELATPNRENGETHYCCLGVAGSICGLTKDELTNRGDLSDIDHISKPVMPTQFFDDGYTLQKLLMIMNDEDNLSFSEIADWIEQNVEFI